MGSEIADRGAGDQAEADVWCKPADDGEALGVEGGYDAVIRERVLFDEFEN